MISSCRKLDYQKQNLGKHMIALHLEMSSQDCQTRSSKGSVPEAIPAEEEGLSAQRSSADGLREQQISHFTVHPPCMSSEQQTESRS